MSKGKIVVVDDDSGILQIMEKLLVEMDFSCNCYASSIEMLEDLRKSDIENIDMVITDYRMPGKDGVVVLKEVLSLDMTMPVIVLTGFSDRRLAIDVLNNGAFGLSEKPVNRVELGNFVQRAWQMRNFHRISRALLQESTGLIKILKEISNAYEKRFTRAENIVYEHLSSANLKTPDIVGLIKSMGEVSSLENSAFAITKHVRELTHRYEQTIGAMKTSQTDGVAVGES